MGTARFYISFCDFTSRLLYQPFQPLPVPDTHTAPKQLTVSAADSFFKVRVTASRALPMAWASCSWVT